MQWFIIGRDMHTLCTASTDLPKSLPINDRGDNYGQNIKIVNNCAVGTYKFTTDPKHEDAKYIQEGNYISFRDKYGKDRLYTIMSVDGDTSWEVSCEDIGLDLVNEYAVPWEYDARSIEDTLSGVLFDTGWVIGINEVSNYKRATVFTGSSDTQLTRIGDVSRQFDAECDFVIEMKGSTVVSQKINIYKSIGEDKTSQRFIDDINLIALRRSGNIEDLITCVRCYGRADENGNKLTIKDIAYDDKRYYSPKGDIRIYDREARNKWSRFRAYNYEGQSEFAGYINGEFEYDTDDPQELFNRALSNLKERNEVKMEYEASLYDLQADIGDTIQIADNRNQEKIYLSARVQEVRNHYSSVGEDTGVLANYKKLQSTPASDVTEIMDQIKDQIVGIKTTEVTYAVSYSGVDIPTEGWVEDPPQTEPGQYLWTRTLTVYTNNSRTLSYSVSRNGADGKPGADGTSVTILGSYASEEELIQAHPTGNKGDAYIVNGDLYVWNRTSWENVGKIQGPQGTPGLPGKDGKTPYVHIKYSNDGGSTFTGNNGEDPGDWLGQYTDFELNDSTNPGDYKWSKIKGDKGDKGDPGNDGQDGLPGADGVSYTIEPSVSEIRRSADGYSPDTLKFAVYRSVGGAAREEFPCYADCQRLSGGEWTSFYQYTGGDPIYEFTILLNMMMTGQADFLKMVAYSDAGFTNQIGECILPVAYNSMETPGTYSSATPPKNPFIGMLWRNTGTSGGYVQNAIYQWDGSQWQMYYFSARNIEAETLSAITAVLGEVISGKITNKVDGKKAVEILENQIDFYDYTNETETFAGSLRGSHIGGLSSRTALQLVLAYAFHIVDSHGAEIMNIYSDGVGINKTLYYNGRNMGRVFGNLPDDTKLQISNINDAISYSEKEEMTNKRWFGSYIYKKTINVGAISGADKTINHGIKDVDVIWVDPAGSFLMASNGMIAPFPRVAKLINEQVSWILTKTQLIVQAGSNANFTACYVTLLYTKTTNPQEAKANETNTEI